MKLRYQLLVAVLLISLTVSSFVAGRKFEAIHGSLQARSRITHLVSSMLTGGEASADSIENVDLTPLESFQQVYSYLRREYAFPIKDEKKLGYAAINGMLASLREAPYDDRYSRFMEPNDYRGFMEENEGHFGGIGAEIGMRAVYQLVIVSPLPDSPAEKAGLLAGDRILKIGGQSTDGLGLGEAVKEIKGVPGSTVDLEIGRDGQDKPKMVTITRSTISVKSADWKMLPDKIGYLHVSGFNDTTTKMVKTGLAELRSQGMRALMLDLRNNPGGGLDVCVDVVGNFIGATPAVYIEERGRPRVPRTPAKGTTALNLPLVVLVNGGSASASEIVAGAIQDTGVGKIVGTTTFGKGLVQTIFPLPDGSALTLTTARYLTPKMRDINHKGIEPDVKVEQPKSQTDMPIPPLSEKDMQAAQGLKILKSEMAAAEKKAA